MKYDFDEIIDRTNTNSENVDGWRPYIFKCGPEKKFPYADDEFVRMWVADMEFAVAPEIRQAIIDRVNRKILGYTIVSDNGYYEALLKWCKDRYDWSFDKDELVFSPGVIPALYQLVAVSYTHLIPGATSSRIRTYRRRGHRRTGQDQRQIR